MRSTGKSLRVSRAKVRLANDPTELRESTRDREHLGVVLIEVTPPTYSDIQTLIRFRQACPETPVLVISEIDDREHILAAFDVGAAGYIRKSAIPSVVSAAMHFVAADESPIPQQRLARHAESPPMERWSLRRSAPNLSHRQMEVLHLVAHGLANKDIARELKLAGNTVKVHLRTAYARLGVCSRTQAMLAATALGIKL